MKPGDRVTFRPTHQPDLLLTGTLVGESAVNILRVESEPGNGSIARIYEAHASQVRPIDPAPAPAEAAPVAPTASAAPDPPKPFDYEQEHQDLQNKIHEVRE